MAGRILASLASSKEKPVYLHEVCEWVPAPKSSPEKLAEVRRYEAEAAAAESEAKIALRETALRNLLTKNE